MFTNRRRTKLTVIHLPKGILLFSNKKEHITGICNMNESQNQTEWKKKPYTKAKIYYDSTYMKFQSEQAKLTLMKINRTMVASQGCWLRD